jgi:hypothetical protein
LERAEKLKEYLQGIEKKEIKEGGQVGDDSMSLVLIILTRFNCIGITKI